MEGKLYPDQNREHVFKLLSRCKELLDLPPVMKGILEVTSGKNSSASNLITLIERDKVLSAGIIAMANSPYFGFSKKVVVASNAVALLGFQEIRNLALSISVVNLFDQKGSDYLDKLWKHNYAVGLATRMVAGYFKLKIEGRFFVAGLLHDIGKIFLCEYLPGKYREMLSMLERNDGKMTYHAMERAFFGTSHTDVAAELLNSWNFPQDIMDAVIWHHEPSRAKTDRVLAACVHIADLICTYKSISPLGDRHFLSIQKEILPVLQGLKENFSSEDIRILMAQLDLEMDRQSIFVSAYKR